MCSKMALFPFICMSSGLFLNSDAQAGVDFFRQTCVANLSDFTGLERHLAALGMSETGDMPSRMLSDPQSLRTWTSHAFPGQPGDGFVQIATGGAAQPFEVCIHVSRPGENATEALSMLRRLYPPIEGSVQRGAHNIYGGKETWATNIDGVEVYVRVSWAFLTDPSSGSSELSLIKRRPNLENKLGLAASNSVQLP